jgi:ABC-2 type transport system ATP-binding protein
MSQQHAESDARLAAGIECRDLRKVYSKKPQPIVAVDQVSFCVPSGQCYGLLGSNGAGKTTVVEMLTGQCQPTSGQVSILGAGRHSEYRDRIGVSLQDMVLPPKLNALETLRLFASFYSTPLDPVATLDLVGLSKQRRQRVQSLSGGQHQRLAFACALIGDPDVLFLDEPTTGVDPASRRQIWDALRSGKKRRTVLLTTHSMDEATQLCDEVMILINGSIISRGSPSDLVDEHLQSQCVRARIDSSVSTDWPSMRELPHAMAAKLSQNEIEIRSSSPGETAAALVKWADERSIPILELEIRRGNLEDVFMKLSTGMSSDV